MQSKIEWYQEVLALEPSSKVFFPLARLFVEIGSLEKAVTTLRMGLDRHPDYLEARLLLVETLVRLDREEEAKAAIDPLTRLFTTYPEFWKLWGDSISGGNRDVAAAIAFAFSGLHGSSMTWSDVMAAGMESLTGFDASKTTSSKCDDSKLAEFESGDEIEREIENAVESINCGCDYDDAEDSVEIDTLKTRTMAEVLASQGDIEGSLEIYRDLASHCSDEKECKELRTIISNISARLDIPAENYIDPACSPEDKDDPYCKHAKSKLMNTLEILASRLEARAAK
jgi:tetratricopeptide (TPR) repeat protein